MIRIIGVWAILLCFVGRVCAQLPAQAPSVVLPAQAPSCSLAWNTWQDYQDVYKRGKSFVVVVGHIPSSKHSSLSTLIMPSFPGVTSSYATVIARPTGKGDYYREDIPGKFYGTVEQLPIQTSNPIQRVYTPSTYYRDTIVNRVPIYSPPMYCPGGT